MKEYCITLRDPVTGQIILRDEIRSCAVLRDKTVHYSATINELSIRQSLSAEHIIILRENEQVGVVSYKYMDDVDNILTLAETGDAVALIYTSGDNELSLGSSGNLSRIIAIELEENTMALSESTPRITMLRLRYLYEMENNTLSDFAGMTLYDVDYVVIE